MKTYKINGKEIERLSNKVYPSQDDFNREIHTKFNSLLEALSDKEDTNFEVWKHSEKDVYKQEECLGCEANKEAPEWKDAIKHTCKPKQEECKHEWSRSTLDARFANCMHCLAGKWIDKEEPKQSTSLKEEITNILCDKQFLPQWRLSEEILKLIQSHLVKEMKQAEPLRLEGESPDFTQGQEWTMRQVIKIINNINK